MNLEQLLQALYDSEINITTTSLWDGGFEVAVVSYIDWYSEYPKGVATVMGAEEIAPRLHSLALEKYPELAVCEVVFAELTFALYL